MDSKLPQHLIETVSVYKEIFEEDVYNLSAEEIKNKGILDLGGHFGLFALYCDQRKANCIISVEPNFNNLSVYLKNTKNIKSKVVCAVVSAQKDTITTIGNKGSTSYVGNGNQLVSTISLSTLIKLFDPALELILKIDVEGSEYEILYNTDPELIKKFKIIVMEAHNCNPLTLGNEAELLKNYIISLGYICIENGIYWVKNFKEVYDMPFAYSYKFIKL